MRLALVLGLMLATAAATEEAPEARQLPYAEQQMCLTWLAVMVQFAEPADSREVWSKVLMRLNRAIDARTDKDTDTAKAEANHALTVFNDWLMKYHAEPIAERVRMILDATGKAKACIDIVPPEDMTEPDVTAPQGDELTSIPSSNHRTLDS